MAGFTQRDTSSMPIKLYDPIVGRDNGVLVRSSGIAYQPTKGYVMTPWESRNWGSMGGSSPSIAKSGGGGGGDITVNIDITVDGVDAAVARLQKLEDVGKDIGKIAEGQCKSLYESIRGSSPVKTGFYRSSWGMSSGGGGNSYNCTISNDCSYACYLVYGHHGRIYHDVRSIVNGWIPAFVASIVGAILAAAGGG